VARRPSMTSVIPLLVLLLGQAGCGGDDQRTDSVTRDLIQETREALDPALVAQLDSGNAATRAGRHAEARTHYRRAVEIDESSAAAWFGVYMSERALGNEQAATDALERARRLAPRASLLEPPEPREEAPP
jgi:tetratricopeptide (TPR) repeat protein